MTFATLNVTLIRSKPKLPLKNATLTSTIVGTIRGLQQCLKMALLANGWNVIFTKHLFLQLKKQREASFQSAMTNVKLPEPCPNHSAGHDDRCGPGACHDAHRRRPQVLCCTGFWHLALANWIWKTKGKWHIGYVSGKWREDSWNLTS